MSKLRDDSFATELAQTVTEIAHLEECGYSELDKAKYLRGFVRGILIASERKNVRICDLEVKLVPQTIVRCACHKQDVVLCPTGKAGESIRVERVDGGPKLSIRRISP